MESTFRSAVFGGFNRQDVTEYISRMATEHREHLERLEQENAALRTQLDGKSELECELDALRSEYEKMVRELEEERTHKETYRKQLEEVRSQVERMVRFQQEAEEYSGVKEHIADIELEARRRADSMLAEAQKQADSLLAEAGENAEALHRCAIEQVESLYEQYQGAMRTFHTAADHAVDELRKMDVTMGQLPLAFDKVQSQLKKLKEQM